MSELGSEVKNLDLLLRAAKAVVKRVESKKSVLDMSYWNSRNGIRVSVVKGRAEDVSCGTSACFAGHMPFLGIPELIPQDEDFTRGLTDPYVLCYGRYIRRIFGLRLVDREFDWFFSEDMSNDVQLLLERVLYYKEHLRPPPNKEWPAWGWMSRLGDLPDE